MVYLKAAIAMILGVYTFKIIICQLQSFSNGMFRSGKISTDMHARRALVIPA